MAHEAGAAYLFINLFDRERAQVGGAEGDGEAGHVPGRLCSLTAYRWSKRGRRCCGLMVCVSPKPDPDGTSTPDFQPPTLGSTRLWLVSPQPLVCDRCCLDSRRKTHGCARSQGPGWIVLLDGREGAGPHTPVFHYENGFEELGKHKGAGGHHECPQNAAQIPCLLVSAVFV